MTVDELRDRLRVLNEANPNIGLAWEWTGDESEPYIRVYETADRHDLAEGPLESIDERITEALESWSMIDPTAEREKGRHILTGIALADHMGDVNSYLPALAELLGEKKPVWSDEMNRMIFDWEEEGYLVEGFPKKEE